jgi:hypothetical protein
MLEKIDTHYLAASMDWQSYIQLWQTLLAQGKTTGSNHSEAMVDYTRLNLQRSKRWMKSYTPSTTLIDACRASKAMIWLVLTEPWCGDAAHNIPPMVKMAEQNEGINLRFLLRDEHPDLMDHFLTDGGRGVPKLLALEPENLQILGTWGPRPKSFQAMVLAQKANPSMPVLDFYEQLHTRYNKDRQQELEQEFLDNLSEWNSV